MAIRERSNNFFMDFEDNGFGGNAMEQNEALANIFYPPAPTPVPAPAPTPVAAPAPTPAPAFTDPLEYLFSLDVERDPERLPVAPPVETPVEFQPSFIETGNVLPPETNDRPVDLPVATDPFRTPEQLPVAPPVETPVEPPVELLAPPAAPQPAPVGKSAEAPAPKTDYTEALTKQILGQGLTGKWSGEGYGSAEKNAADMAKILSGIGITDIKQFGKVDKYEPVEKIGQTLNGQPVQGSGSDLYIMETVGSGDDAYYARRNLSPEEAEKVKPVYGVQSGIDEYNAPTYQPVNATNVTTKDGRLVGVTGQTFGNKQTGQAVPNTYTERQTGDFFGGTYEGKGNTGYGVQFDAQGNPVFYTQGASSSDVGSLAPFLTLASFVPGLAPFAMAANAAIAAKQGNVLGAITSLAGAGGLAGISGMSDIANAARFAGAVKSGDPLAMLFSGANLGGITDIGGINLKDASKTIGAVKAIESGDPLALLPYLSSIAPKDSVPSATGGGEKDFIDAERERLTSEGVPNDQIKNYLQNLERLTEDLDYEPEAPPVDSTPPIPTRSLTAEPQIEEADDFLKSIGINTLDKPSDSGLSNEGILNLINADNEMVITGNRDTVGRGVSEDILRNLENAGELPLPTPEKKLEELVIKGDRPKEEMTVQQEPTGVDEFIKSLQPYIAPAPTGKLEELVMTGKRPMPSPDEDFPATPITGAEKLPELVVTGNQDKTKEHVFDPTFGGTLPLPEPVTATPPAATPKVPAPAVKPTTPAPSAPSSGMDLMGLLALLGGQQQPTQQAPMQDPYAHIKLMEDLFGSTIDLTPAGENTAQRK